MHRTEQQVLDAIDSEIQTRDARLASMFMIFTRLTAGEAKPRQENLPGPGRSRRRRPSLRLRWLLTLQFARRRGSDRPRRTVPPQLPAG